MSSGRLSGLNVSPFGYIMHMIKQMEVPIISDNANLINSILVALYPIKKHDMAR